MPGENEIPNGEQQSGVETPPPQPGGQSGEPKGRSYTDQEVNDFLSREKRKWSEADDIKAGKAAIKRLSDIEAASKSEAEKLTERATAAEAERDRMTTQLRTALIRGEFTRLAAGKALSPQQIADAFALADQAGIAVGEDGQVTGADKALDAVLKDRPYLAGGQNGQRPAPNINPGGGNAAANRDERIEQARKELQQTGRYGRL